MGTNRITGRSMFAMQATGEILKQVGAESRLGNAWQNCLVNSLSGNAHASRKFLTIRLHGYDPVIGSLCDVFCDEQNNLTAHCVVTEGQDAFRVWSGWCWIENGRMKVSVDKKYTLEETVFIEERVRRILAETQVFQSFRSISPFAAAAMENMSSSSIHALAAALSEFNRFESLELLASSRV